MTADNYGGQLLGNKMGLLAYQKVQKYYNSDNSGDYDRPRKGGRDSDVQSASHSAALVNPKSATAADLLAACYAITSKCGPAELQLLMESDDVPSRSAAELKVQRYGGLPNSGDDYGGIVVPPCFACNGDPGSTGIPPITPNNTQAVVAPRLPPSPPPLAG